MHIRISAVKTENVGVQIVGSLFNGGIYGTDLVFSIIQRWVRYVHAFFLFVNIHCKLTCTFDLDTSQRWSLLVSV